MASILNPDEYDPFYQGYISRYRGNEQVTVSLKKQLNEFDEMLKNIPENQGKCSYAPGKWSIKELLGHVVDAERIFSYRAFCISRGEKADLNGMDQDVYARNSGAGRRTIASIASEFYFVRQASIALLQSLSQEQWSERGKANGSEITVKALAVILYGHCDHHIHILKSRYLN